ncbi:phosphotransferase [Leptospira sp. 2 VSF19]|uniref:Phosphotransferase n=1 Tax=Leptospira soteropolitanensis TaxID=2950025 RepID=A0AAW5VK47_9LEPT|nr:aminoglycoside phosphotransferase family protein [Leptospira soteropolitanensis]MCW7494278.1 phosphotransferase [Leptospira soteropolitanensis]MCW7501747.1 phosphotransferase [Leptospira soteropolitanensis]MCW7524124.1 phosphotransferase [Leptospira soteropolitanensis]MCW7527989.1 phosphotransferase [Leptospira soteropolitanensis]MCW7531717.1 phosphotransferase [Leptospira soteropolitanensis]
MDHQITEFTMTSLGKPIAIGRSADLFALPENRILKLFFPEANESEIDLEVENTIEANRMGASRMRCYGKAKVGERLGIIFDRLNGISLTKLPDKNPLELFRIAGKLAKLHYGIHQINSEKFKDIKEILNHCLDSNPLSFLSLSEKEKAKSYIAALPKGSSILHLDFHPENVIVEGKDEIIIDWMTAAKGNSAADVAFTYLLFTDGELWPGTPKLKIIFYTIIRKFILSGYLKVYKSLSGMSDVQIAAWRLPALILRLGLWNIESERESLKTQITRLVANGGKV